MYSKAVIMLQVSDSVLLIRIIENPYSYFTLYYCLGSNVHVNFCVNVESRCKPFRFDFSRLNGFVYIEERNKYTQ